MGALFHRPALSCTWDALDEFLRARSLPLWGADAGGAPVDGLRAPAAPGLALAVGNEGAGLSAETRSRAARLVSIPIAPDVESLNVAVAAGILLHHFRT
jgi:TrmH family RNA methyltransferase